MPSSEEPVPGRVPVLYRKGANRARMCDAPVMPPIPEPCAQPIFVLTASRSGSTLLRFILDSHPDIACPPETTVASACAALARVWDLLEGAPSGSGRPVTEPLKLPPHAVRAVRAAADQAFASYLGRRGKRRWCDKSLDSHHYAELMTQVYPEAKFICLYRHCMDVVASGVETCPWGLARFGFDPFVAQHPGNSVAAIGSYWLATVQMIMAFEESHPGACHRLRYEDLVTAPEQTAADVFSFLDAAEAPGITRDCFRSPHEGGGPGDEKIWFTAEVTADSMGRGVSVPGGALPEPLREPVNEALTKLGYRVVDDQWNATSGRSDVRADPPRAPVDAIGGARDGEPSAESVAMAEALRARIDSADPLVRQEIGTRWPTVAGATVALVVESADSGPRELRISLSPPGLISAANGHDRAADGQAATEPVATLFAGAATWQALLDRRSNPVTEITAGRLRCVNRRDSHRIRSDELHAIAALLGLAQLPVPASGGKSPHPAVAG